MRLFARQYSFVLLAALVLAACNLPRSSAPTVAPIDVIRTQAAQTMVAQLTEISKAPATPAWPGYTPGIPAAGAPTAGSPAGGTPTVPPPVNPSAPPAATQVGTPAPEGCNKARFVDDVTYPDNTSVAPGQTFVKTWRLENTGECSWTPAYTLIFTGGERMGTSESAPLTSATVAPGQMVDVSVTLKAPEVGGKYRSEWKLRDGAGQVFGIGKEHKPVWALIKVEATTGFDFISRADEAGWTSGAPGEQPAALPFNGPDGNPAGVAKIYDFVLMENGITSGKVLYTLPRLAPDGWVSGLYPAFTIQPGNRLVGTLGFIVLPDGSCGDGRVRFQISYKEGEQINLLYDQVKTCTGDLLSVDIDLSGLKGRTVQFILTARAEGDYEDDWAIWNSVRVK